MSFNPYMNYNSPISTERIDRQIEELNNLKRQIQQPVQPINNFISTGNTSDFEAHYIQGEELPENIIISRRTAFIDLNKGKLSIKEVNGDIKSYEIVLPKTPEQIENEQLKSKLKEMEAKIHELSTNSEYGKSTFQDNKSTNSSVGNVKSTTENTNE